MKSLNYLLGAEALCSDTASLYFDYILYIYNAPRGKEGNPPSYSGIF